MHDIKHVIGVSDLLNKHSLCEEYLITCFVHILYIHHKFTFIDISANIGKYFCFNREQIHGPYLT